MRNDTIVSWLDALASAEPTPGGGAAAAMNTAVGAALVEMVTNLTIGKRKYAQYEETMREARDRAAQLRAHALELAQQDEDAFNKVMSAYAMPKDDEAAVQERTASIQAALVEAAEVPLRIAETAAEIVTLSQRILDGANVNLISDITVAVESANAALRSAKANVDINLAGLKDTERREKIAGELRHYMLAVPRGEEVAAIVSRRVTGG